MKLRCLLSFAFLSLPSQTNDGEKKGQIHSDIESHYFDLLRRVVIERKEVVEFEEWGG
jgi:hypothetical protein